MSDQVGITLAEALSKLNKSILEQALFKHKKFSLVTFGEWELAYQLEIETHKKQIVLN